jgi:putative alpha-1,2-mannosidase
VPHDPQGLVELMGRGEFERKLTAFFELTPKDLSYRNPYFSVENEIVHTVPYLFTSIGQPWQTQKWLRFALANAFRTGVYGLPGNDDVGQMSAWYVLNAIGLHPLDPAGGVLIIGSPIFDRITLALDRRYYAGERFTITVRNNGADNPYVQSARLNGIPLERAWLRVEEVTRGGELELVMGRGPNRDWGANPRNFPPSWSRP